MEEIKKYLKDNLSINIKEESYGFNGQCITIEIQLENEVISSASYTTKQDQG